MCANWWMRLAPDTLCLVGKADFVVPKLVKALNTISRCRISDSLTTLKFIMPNWILSCCAFRGLFDGYLLPTEGLRVYCCCCCGCFFWNGRRKHTKTMTIHHSFIVIVIHHPSLIHHSSITHPSLIHHHHHHHHHHQQQQQQQQQHANRSRSPWMSKRCVGKCQQ